jgi:hypothetical protein
MTKPTCDLHKQTRNAYYRVNVWDIDVCEECKQILQDDEGFNHVQFIDIGIPS